MILYKLNQITKEFETETEPLSIKPLNEGFINGAYIVEKKSTFLRHIQYGL